VEFIVSTTKRKLTTNDETSKNSEKRQRKSFKDNPTPITTPAIRRIREKEIENRIIVKNKNQLHPSIMAQPNINIEKAKGKQIRNKERANFGNNKEKRKEREDNITIREKQSLDSSKQKNSISTTSDKVHQRLNKLIDDENDKIIKTKQIKEMEVIEVPEKLNDEGQENITLQKLIDFQEPKEKSTINRTLRNIKMCKEGSGRI